MRSALAIALTLVASGCGDDGAAPASGARGSAGPRDPRLDQPLPAEAVRLAGRNYHVLAGPIATCPPVGACTVAADLHADNGFKVNPDYPHKLIEPSAALAAPATFARLTTTRGRLLMTVDRTAPGPTTVGGTFKFSVCSADVCDIEKVTLAVAVP